MPKIDESRPFLPVNIAVLTVSDTRTAADDRSGKTRAVMSARDGHLGAAAGEGGVAVRQHHQATGFAVQPVQ